MKTIIRNNILLLSLFSLFIIAGLILLYRFPKGDFELLVNRQHEPYLDQFFFYITYLGDGRILVPVIILIFFRKIYYGILALSSFLLSTFITQSVKRLLFSEYPRPSKFFEKNIDIHVIEGLELHSYYSFPSGHSSGVFAVFFLLGMFSKNIYVSIGCFLIGVLAAFSRVYLMQHFFIDIYFGAIIGVFSGMLTYYIFEKKSNLPLSETINKPLLKTFSKKK